ncbi:hypothetical protein [Paenibacillus sp. 1781tsa1]|uniref:hypothetical protein n=1 Tax=Paenibacillus sp. 1781tsa1 TaxID=2953810 RepID=UPI00209EF7D6|nr:hypothetical protein [Paenibacillus sp. 1781tsa1]MCP1184779.1 hypothetical protein [Paenibacillus sp. 1781tsa1]
MRKMKTKSAASILKITLVALFMVPTLLAIPTSEPAVASPIIKVSSAGALTAPPPPEPSIHSLANTRERGHIYQAVGAVIPGGGLSAIVNTKTTTYTAMKTLSVDYRLERWTGTVWVTFKANSNTATNSNLLNATSDWTVMPGYYYRVTSIHTAYDGSTTDTSKHVSGTVLF